MPSIHDISPNTEPAKDFPPEQGKQKDTQLREHRFRLMAQTQGFMFSSATAQCLSWTCGDPKVSEFGCTSLFPHFQNLNETAHKPKQDPKTTNTSAEFLSQLTKLDTKTTYETRFTWLGRLTFLHLLL